MMGIFVPIFSLVSINFNQLNSKNLTADFILKMNLSLGIIIALFIGLIMFFFRNREDKNILKIFIGLMVVMIIVLFFIL